MNIVAYTALHYGTDYLGYAIKSIIDYVDTYYVLYTPIGSHGFRTDLRCPDKREDLKTIASAVAKDKLIWIDGTWDNEGAHRNVITDYTKDADEIVVLDADEIWTDEALALIGHSPSPGIRGLRINMIHFWRSFHRAVVHDPASPVRIIRPWAVGAYTSWMLKQPICHMGYAQRSDVVYYKQFTHGHRGEWRRDVDWYNARFLANAQQDCHPVGSEYWNPELVNPWDYMPAFMHQHPYADMEVIP